jgi:ribosomal protein S18 acetylase RimI-like enzyme
MTHPMQYSLRPVTDKDYDFLYHLHVATIRPTVEATWGWDEAFQADYFRSRWDPSQRQIIVVDRTDIGVVTLEERPEAVFLALIEIRPAYQDQGIGTAVIREVMADAHRRGLPVELHILKANVEARRLYERLGFRLTEERAERYVMRAPAPDPDAGLE